MELAVNLILHFGLAQFKDHDAMCTEWLVQPVLKRILAVGTNSMWTKSTDRVRAGLVRAVK